MRHTILALAMAASISGATAETAQPNALPPDRSCPPETRQAAPGNNNTDLSDKLADSRGVICPPAVDPAMTQPPPAGGAIKVVPPPGSPGGDPTVQPK
jgi:hypothetical protein